MERFGRRSATWLRTLLPVMAVALLALALTACGGSNAKDASASQAQPAQQQQAAAPAAATAAPAAPAAAAPAAESRMYVYADTVIGSKGMTAEEKPFRSCTMQSRFAPGEQLGWRVKVYDAATGKKLTADDGVTVQIKLGDGQVFDAKYGDHGGTPPTDSFFAYFWVIPTDYPTGLLPYTITATKGSETAVFTSEEMQIKSSQLTIQAPQS